MKKLALFVCFALASCTATEEATAPDGGATTSAAGLINGCSTGSTPICLTRTCATICYAFTCCLNGVCTSTMTDCTANTCKNKQGKYCGSW
jgi:hypothetical protein